MISVSCIIPCYNNADTISRAVHSVIGQRSPVQEIILVDDCSSDTTWDVLQHLASASEIIKTIRLDKNSGPSVARNLGWELASSEWIAFLDADDTWHAQKIELLRKAAEMRPDVSLYGHFVDVRDPTLTTPDQLFSDSALRSAMQYVSARSLKISSPFPTPSAVVRRDVPFRFDESMRYVEDYFLWASLVLSGFKCIRIKLPLGSLYKARYGASGLSAQTGNMREGEIAALHKLRTMGLLGPLEYPALSLFWYLKYLRRRWL